MAEDVGRALEDWNGRQEAAPPRSQDSPATVPILYVSFDGTGVPMRKSELDSFKGKGPDSKTRTREVKLGYIFTQSTNDEAGCSPFAILIRQPMSVPSNPVSFSVCKSTKKRFAGVASRLTKSSFSPMAPATTKLSPQPTFPELSTLLTSTTHANTSPAWPKPSVSTTPSSF